MCCFELYKIDVVRYRNARFGWHFPAFGCCSELLQVQENSVRAQQHGPCCTTRAPVLLCCVDFSEFCFLCVIVDFIVVLLDNVIEHEL